jgi:hypothetical protein
MMHRAVAQLPQLRNLLIKGSAAPSTAKAPPPISHSLLPLLGIRSFDLSPDVLSLFVMWTRLPPGSSAAPATCRSSCSGLSPQDAIRFDVHSTSSANRGWLDTLLHHQLPVNFYITQDSNLSELIPNLKRCHQPLGITLLDAMVDAEQLGELLAAYSGQQLTLSISTQPDMADDTQDVQQSEADAEGEEGGDDDAAVLTDRHLQPILSHVPRLTSLNISSSAALSDRAVRDVVQGLGDGLTRLCLSDARNVTDWTLWALLRSCPNLQRLELSGAPGVTEVGLAPLLVFLQPVFSAKLCGTGVDRAKLQHDVEGQGAQRCIFHEYGGGAASGSSGSSSHILEVGKNHLPSLWQW